MRLARRFRLASLAVALALTAGVVIALSGWFGGRADAQRAGGAMATDCDVATGGVQSSCAVAPGATFSIQVHATESVPADPTAGTPVGYLGFQSKVLWVAGNVDYLPAPTPSTEILWPDCTGGFPARSVNAPTEPSVLIGCASGVGAAPSTYTGALVELQFQCLTDGPTDLTLVSRAGPPADPQGGTHFVDAAQETVDPTLAGATVDCGGPTPTPPPGGATATRTPPGGVTPGAATATTRAAGVAPTALPPTGAPNQGQSDDNGLLLLIGVVAAASVAGLSVFGWKYARNRR